MLETLLYFALPAAIGVFAAWFFRARLRAMRWNILLFALMVGALAPLLLGQLVSLALVGPVEAAIAECRQGAATQDCPGAEALVWPLLAGVAAGFGWLGGALGFKFTGGGE